MTDCRRYPYKCTIPRTQLVLTALAMSWAYVYFAVYFAIIFKVCWQTFLKLTAWEDFGMVITMHMLPGR